MSDSKSQKIRKLVERVPDGEPLETVPEGLSLLEVGLFGVLRRKLTESQANKTLTALRRSFPDWNELRVSQVQEFTGAIASRSEDVSLRVAFAIKEFLQEIFQKNHGFDLERFREDPAEAAKFFTDLPVTGPELAHRMLAAAAGGEVPATLGIVRVLDRTGVVKRTSSIKRAQQTLAPLVPEGQRAEFGAKLGKVAEAYCDSKKPICWECPLVGVCPFGTKVEKEWRVQQERLEAQRKKGEERRRKEEEKERKRLEAEEERRQKELERRREKERREKEREAARKAREAERAKKAAERKAAAEKRKKEAAKKKKAAAKQKASAKQAAKKTTTRKAKSAKARTTKKGTTKKGTTKKGTTKKGTTKKGTTKKGTTKKSTAKKTAAEQTTARKTTSKTKKTTARKPAASKQKATKKKPTARKTTSRSGTTKKGTGRKTTSRSKAGGAGARKSTKRTTRKGTAKKTSSGRKRTKSGRRR